jgi:hypothetical protein
MYSLSEEGVVCLSVVLSNFYSLQQQLFIMAAMKENEVPTLVSVAVSKLGSKNILSDHSGSVTLSLLIRGGHVLCSKLFMGS